MPRTQDTPPQFTLHLAWSEAPPRWHYLKDIKAVGEQIWYGVFDQEGQWLGVLVFCAASRRLHARDTWIGWSEEQRRRRLALVVNNARFLLLPYKTVPNLASRTLGAVKK